MLTFHREAYGCLTCGEMPWSHLGMISRPPKEPRGSITTRKTVEYWKCHGFVVPQSVDVNVREVLPCTTKITIHLGGY